MSEKTTPEPAAQARKHATDPAESRDAAQSQSGAEDADVVLDTAGASVLRQIFAGNAMVSVLSVLLAIVLGGILMAVTNPKVAATAGYFFALPGDLLTEVFRPYTALVQGSIFNWAGADLAAQLYPITETLTVATPLICAGLGVALAFRAGLFNIGAQGQIIFITIIGSPVPSQFMAMLPYALTVIAVAGLVGRSRPPAADGIPYVKG